MDERAFHELAKLMLRGPDNSDFERFQHTVLCTWYSASRVASVILLLFFARYPHRNGIDPSSKKLKNEVA